MVERDHRNDSHTGCQRHTAQCEPLDRPCIDLNGPCRGLFIDLGLLQPSERSVRRFGQPLALFKHVAGCLLQRRDRFPNSRFQVCPHPSDVGTDGFYVRRIHRLIRVELETCFDRLPPREEMGRKVRAKSGNPFDPTAHHVGGGLNAIGGQRDFSCGADMARAM